MSKPILMTITVACLGLGLGYVAAAQQQAPITAGQPFPGAGSGILTVGGTVNIGNTPSVTAAQDGDWRVAVTNFPPTVRTTPPEFLRQGGRYEITWAAGEREDVIATAVGPGSWVAVQHAGGARWVNVGAARAIREVGQ
jgi:hypothetical protein